MNIDRFAQNINDQVTEAHLKLGYCKETVRLYYPLSSLNAYLGEHFKTLSETVAALEDTFSAKKPEDQLQFRISGDRLEVLLGPDTVESIHKKIRPEPFLSDLIAYFSSVHHPNMDDVLRIFRKYSNDLIIEEVPEEAGFDTSVHFADPSIDEYFYCFKDEMDHLIYHRFMKEDYLQLLSI